MTRRLLLLQAVRQHLYNDVKVRLATDKNIRDLQALDARLRKQRPHPTRTELLRSADFWHKRIEQQAEYIARFDIDARTRPDKQAVLNSAIEILERCQRQLLKLTNGKVNNRHRQGEKAIQ